MDDSKERALEGEEVDLVPNENGAVRGNDARPSLIHVPQREHRRIHSTRRSSASAEHVLISSCSWR